MPRSAEAIANRKVKRNKARQERFIIVHRVQPPVPQPTQKHFVYPPPENPYSHLLISKNSLLLNENWDKISPITENDIDAVVVKKLFTNDPLYQKLAPWVNQVATTYVYPSHRKKENCRGVYECICFGIHRQVGYQTIHWTKASKFPGSHESLAQFNPLFAKIGKVATQYFPVCVETMTKDIPPKYLLFDEKFGYGMFHITPISWEHIDFGDMGICIVLPFGESFVGGRLSFTYLNVEYNLKPGDIIIFRSCKLLHTVTEVIAGLRQSFVLTSQKYVIEKIKEGWVPL